MLAAGERGKHVHSLRAGKRGSRLRPLTVDEEGAARHNIGERLACVGGAGVARRGVGKQLLEGVELADLLVCSAGGGPCGGEVMDLHALTIPTRASRTMAP